MDYLRIVGVIHGRPLVECLVNSKSLLTFDCHQRESSSLSFITTTTIISLLPLPLPPPPPPPRSSSSSRFPGFPSTSLFPHQSPFYRLTFSSKPLNSWASWGLGFMPFSLLSLHILSEQSHPWWGLHISTLAYDSQTHYSNPDLSSNIMFIYPLDISWLS